MTDQEMSRFAVVGTGAISQIVHVPILVERSDVAVVAVSDTDTHKADSVANRYGVPERLTPKEVMAREDLDAVVICTPPASHEDLAVAALESGKHVFVERPLAMTPEGVERVLEAALAAGKLVGIGQPHRFRPDVAVLKSFVAGGDFGRCYAAKGSWLIRPVPVSRPAWRSDRTKGGGALMDLGVPALDLCLGVLGYPAVERLTCHMVSDGEGVEHAASLMMHTANGITLTVEVTERFYADADRQYVRVLGTDGSAELPPLAVYKQLGGRPLEVTPRQPRPRGGENPYMNAYRRGIDHFVRGVRGLGEVELPTEQVALMRVIEAAYRSARDGAEVVL